MNLDNPLWHFAIQFYLRPGMQAHLLRLQEESLPVNLLLAAAWCVHNRVDPQLLLDEQAAANWRAEITAPTRALRYRLRPYQKEIPDVYEQYKKAELAAEQVEIALLWNSLRSAPRHQARCTEQALLELFLTLQQRLTEQEVTAEGTQVLREYIRSVFENAPEE